MGQTLDRIFLDLSAKRLEQLFSRIRSCLEKLNADQVWARGSENENAIGNLVLHLAGNVRQWIVSGVGGKPDTRVRDREFSARGEVAVAELAERLQGVLNEAVAVLDQVTAERLAEHVRIQNYDLTVMEAIAHVVEHFAQHTGQIIFATKMLTGEDLGFYKHLKTTAAHAEKTP
jgi:uncharacterized damage-inducible protein DinB